MASSQGFNRPLLIFHPADPAILGQRDFFVFSKGFRALPLSSCSIITDPHKIMSPKELIHRWMDEVWNRGNVQFIYQHMAEKCRVHGLEPTPDTPEKFEAFHQGMCSAISNIHITVLESYEYGDNFMATCELKGLDRNTNVPVAFSFAVSGRVVDDKLVEVRNIVDFLSYLTQIDQVNPNLLNEKFHGST